MFDWILANNKNDNKRIVYYYQTFSTLKPLVDLNLKNVYVYISSLHFGKNNNIPYLHLNDDTPTNQGELWDDVKKASENDINILVMLGGAGGAYSNLFRDFDGYYPLLFNFLKKYPFIKGIDLDVEESTSLENIELLINTLNKDFGDQFIITMAPIVSAIQSDYPGLGGFSYKKLMRSDYGKKISWLNVQCYGEYTFESYQSCIKNGYDPSLLVFGMLGDNYTIDTFKPILTEIEKMYNEYKESFGGVMMWEYGDTKISPITWGNDISKILENIDEPTNLNTCWII